MHTKLPRDFISELGVVVWMNAGSAKIRGIEQFRIDSRSYPESSHWVFETRGISLPRGHFRGSEAGSLLIIEFILPSLVSHADPQLEVHLMSDLKMLAVTGGRERSERQWRRLLEAAGFILNKDICGWRRQSDCSERRDARSKPA
jgi:hypothetical protein